MRDIRAMLVELVGEGGLLSFEDTLFRAAWVERHDHVALLARPNLAVGYQAIDGQLVPLRVGRWPRRAGKLIRQLLCVDENPFAGSPAAYKPHGLLRSIHLIGGGLA